MSMGREATQVPLRQDEVCGCTGEGLRLHTSPKALVMSGTQGPMSRHQRVWAVTPGRRHTTEGPQFGEPLRFVLCGASSVYLMIGCRVDVHSRVLRTGVASAGVQRALLAQGCDGHGVGAGGQSV